jgi:hypothetical protein
LRLREPISAFGSLASFFGVPDFTLSALDNDFNAPRFMRAQQWAIKGRVLAHERKKQAGADAWNLQQRIDRRHV